MKRIPQPITIVLISLLSLAMTTTVQAQDTPPAEVAEEKDPRLLEAELRAAIAEQEKKEADARKAKIEANNAASLAKFPGSGTTGVDGAISVSDGAGYYAEVLAYDSLSAGVNSIVETLMTAPVNGTPQISTGSSVIIIDSLELSNEAAQHQLIETELQRVIDKLTVLDTNAEITRYTQNTSTNGFLELEPGKRESFSVALTAIPAALGLARDVSKFFQTEVNLKNRALSIDNTALKANLSRALLAKDIEPILPETSVSQLRSFSPNYQAMITLRSTIDQKKLIAESYAAQKKAELETEKASQQLIVATSVAKIAALKKENKPTAAEEGKKNGAEFTVKLIDATLLELEKKRTLIVGYLDAGLKSADDLSTALTTPNTAGVTPIQAVAVIDLIKSDSSRKLLYAEIVGQGAEIQTTKKAFKGDVTYIGGTTISYLLLNDTGSVIEAGTEIKLNTKKFKRGKSIEGMSRP